MSSIDTGGSGPVAAELATIATKGGLDAATGQQVIDKMVPLATEAARLIRAAEAVRVTDATQVTEMRESRKLRLELRTIRVGVDHTRKQLKEESLRRGQAIDAVAAYLRERIEPVEARLLEQEEFAERAEAARLAEIRARRTAILAPLGVDTTVLDLERMSDDFFASIVTKAKADQEAKLKAEREAAEAARVKAEQEAAERERLRVENARLEAEAAKARAEAQAARAAADKERRDREEAEAKARREKQEAEAKAAREAEAKRAAEAAEAERLASGSDKEKLRALLEMVPAVVPWPEMRSRSGKAAIAKARELYEGAISTLELAAK